MKWFVLMWVSSFLSISYVTPSLGKPTSYLPLNHRAYDFLEIMENKYHITNEYSGTKPITRTEIASFLFSLEKKKTELTQVEKAELDCLLDEFRPDFFLQNQSALNNSEPIEILPDFFKSFVYRNHKNLYSSVGENYSLYFDPVIVRNASIGRVHETSKDDNVYTSSNGFILRGTIGEHVGFHIDIRDSKEWGSREYPVKITTTMPGRGYATFKGDHAEFDETFAHVCYTNGPFVIFYGRDRNVWGRGKKGTLALSSYGSPYDMARLETSFWHLKFVFFAAEIEQNPPVARFYYNYPPGVFSDSVVVKKHMSGHRVEINITDRLNLGFYETVVYGGRWDLSYLNPVMFLKGGEHTNFDHDNAVMGMDFRFLVRYGLSIYSELLIDDMTTSKLGTDWYGNKIAYQLGTFYIEPFGLRDTDVRVEYSHINPWVYTHQFPINTYTHYGDVLGHQIGPNSDELSFEIRKRFSRRFHTAFSWSKRRHGADTEEKKVGGDPLEGFRQGYSTKAKFLDGELEKTNTFGIDVSYELLWELFLRIGYTYENFNGNAMNTVRFSLGLNE
ncbi:MAG TPA: capsule assembly Wzi family protein [Anaerolineae bacterium]|nr:capsule assembly Wzi family protein [Anaerolineae bacterium]